MKEIKLKNIIFTDDENQRMVMGDTFNFALDKESGISACWGETINDSPEYDPISPQELIFKIDETFDLNKFLDELYRITNNTIIIFCGQGQLSQIFTYFLKKQYENKGTVRQLVWRKTNPSPMNGDKIYLSGIENAVWFKYRGGYYSGFCKNTVFDYPTGSSEFHPTEKNHGLLKELILDNSKEGDIVFDPCVGSGSHLLVAFQNMRNYLGCELNEHYYKIAEQRLQEEMPMLRLLKNT